MSITLPVTDVVGSSKTFSWSDFPCQGHDLLLLASSRSLASFDSLDYTDDDDSSHDSDETDCSKAACPTSSPRSTMMVRHLQVDACASSHIIQALPPPRRVVSFDPVMRVRTYDVILGDHPCCVGGMALQCSWEHAPEDELMDLDLAEQYSSKRRMGQLQLNYSQRRHRLSATTGLTAFELLQEEFKIRAAGQPTLAVRSNMLKRPPTLQSLTQQAAMVSSTKQEHDHE